MKTLTIGVLFRDRSKRRPVKGYTVGRCGTSDRMVFAGGRADQPGFGRIVITSVAATDATAGATTAATAAVGIEATAATAVVVIHDIAHRQYGRIHLAGADSRRFHRLQHQYGINSLHVFLTNSNKAYPAKRQRTVIFVPSLFGRLSVRLLLSADRSLLWLCSALAL